MSGWKPLLRQVLFAASDLLWPRSCLICSTSLPESVSPDCLCSSCIQQISTDPFPTCPRCSSSIGLFVDASQGCPRCHQETFPFQSAQRFGPYEGLLQQAILRGKQPGGEALAETLGRIWAMSRRERLLQAGDTIVPIPLHWQRRWSRGFNQSEAIARGMATILGRPFLPFAILRVRSTPKQTGTTRAERLANMAGAFRPARQLTGMRILLIDDVLTTGATASAATQALMQAGAAQVTVAVLAHR